MRFEAIVVNTGPLIALSGIGQLRVLVHLFDRVMVPATVGTARLLVEAKRAGLIDSIGEALGAIRANGYWVDDKIAHWAKVIAGEEAIDG